MKPTFTNHLKTLMLGGAMALVAGQTSNAAAIPSSSSGESSVDQRVAKVREAVNKQAALNPDLGSGHDGADLMWWRNAWGNGGGWHNWGNGWHNWHNGGWGNWHNF